MRTSYTILVSLMLLVPIGVIAVNAQESEPNLTPTGLTRSPSDPMAGENVTFEAVIENNGSAEAGTFNVTFLVDGEQHGENITIESLADGSNTTVTSENWTATAGDHTITVVADSDEQVAEQFEDDNEASTTVTLQPDLVATSATHTPSDAYEGQTVTFEAELTNEGSADAGAFNVTFLVDGEQVGDNVTVESLATGEILTVTSGNHTATEGEHELTVQVDSQDTVSETNETNNELTQAFTIAPDEADLVVLELTHSPEAPYEGQNVTFTATVENQGNTAAENVTVQFTLDGEQLGGNQTVTLAAGQNATLTSADYTSVEGEHTAAVTLDPDNTVEETDEENNTAQDAFTVEPDEADLVVTDIAPDPAEPEAGENVTFTATVENQGHTEAGNTTLVFRLNGTQLGDAVNVSSLAPGESTQVTSQAWNASEGNHEIEAEADTGDNVTEADESNNERTETLAIGQAPELVAEELTADPAEPAPGQNATFTVTIANEGELDASSFEVAFHVDGEQVGENVTVEGLAAGETTTVTSGNWTATEGEHTATATVDADEQVDEDGESDNTATVTLTVEAEEDDATDDVDGNETEEQEAEKMTICHRPPGNPDNEHTITIGEPAWEAHEGHGDHEGACEENDGNHTSEETNETSQQDGNATAEEQGNHTASDEEDPEASSEDDEPRRAPPEHAPGNGRGEGR